jgi:hypothetical protein
VIVDATDGSILARTNLTRYAEGRVLLATHPEPEYDEYEQAQHQLVPFPAVTAESPQGWVAGDGTQLRGNNAVSHLGFPSQPGLASATGSYDYPFNTNESALVNAWYWVNEAHDRFYAAGFEEAAGNFQQDNFGHGGAGADPVRVVAWPSVRGGYFTSTVDGETPILGFGWQGFHNYMLVPGCLWCDDHDGFPENGGDRSIGFMRDVLFHEYAHGVVGRRVGGPADDTCLTALQPDEMEEGWSDLFAASFFDDHSFGDYKTQSQGFVSDLRHDLSIEDLLPYGLAPFGRLVWGATLWDLRQSMTALDPPSGLANFHRLIVEALAITPCNPTYLEARDAILAADTLLFSSAHHAMIWNVFASRGMGQLASTVDENEDQPTADHTIPASFACAPPSAPAGVTATVEDDNAIRLSYSVPGASAVEIWRENLDNPADAAERIASSRDLATFLDRSVHGGKRYRYHVVALGAGGVVCRSAPSATADATATGACSLEFPLFVPNVTFADGDPSCELTLTWNAATPACPGSAEGITYSIYRGQTPGFLPSDRLLVGRTTGTSYSEVPPRPLDSIYANWFTNNWHYLVLAQHGTLEDPPDHRDRGSAQVMQWRSAMPTLGRTTVHFWNFDSGPQGWTPVAYSGPWPEYEWRLVDPIGTYYGGALRAPDEPAGGAGMAWVTGDQGVPPASVMSNTCSELLLLFSPVWDARNGATLVSFDYWSSQPYYGELYASMWICAGGPPPNNSGLCSREIGLQTTQRFNGPGRYGWQHFELDLADLLRSQGLSPSATQTIVFAGADCDLSEYGIDNVRVERATVCSRSDLELLGITVDDTASGWGNGNGVLEPGEIVRLDLSVKNEGSVTAIAPAATITSASRGVTILDPAAGLPDIPASGSGASTDDDFVVALEPASCSGTAVFELAITDASGARATTTWTPEVGTLVTEPILADDFQTDRGWTTSGAGLGHGMWERGDPQATFDGTNLANPEDCRSGAGTLCWVTGLAGGDPNANDVDPGADAVLQSPALAVDGYKRLSFSLDAWVYRDFLDSDWLAWSVRDDDGNHLRSGSHNGSNSSWRRYTTTLLANPLVPAGTQVRLAFTASDGQVDGIMEGAIDEVLIEGQRQVCQPSGVQAPNPVGWTVTAGTDGSDVRLIWSPPPTDATHDAAVFYEVLVSGAPAGGFAVGETAMSPTATRPLASPSEYYLVTAVNGGGKSS